MNSSRRFREILYLVISVVGVFGVAFGWYFYFGPGKMVPVSVLAANPVHFDERVVRVRVGQALPTDTIPGHRALRIADGDNGWAPLIPGDTEIAKGSIVHTRAHRVSVFGHDRIVLELVHLSADMVWNELLRTVGIGGRGRMVRREKTEPLHVEGVVLEETELLGFPAFSVRADHKAVYVVARGAVPPAGADVSVTAEKMAGTDFLGAPAIYEVREVLVSVSSVTSSPHIFGDRDITVQGKVGSCVAAFGGTAFTVTADGEHELIVVVRGIPPANGTTINATGKVKHLTVFGKTLLLCLAADRVEVKAEGSSTPNPGTS